MRKKTSRLALSLMLLSLLGSGDSPRFDGRVAMDGLVGTWRLAEIQVADERCTNSVGGPTLTFQRGTFKHSGEGKQSVRGTYAIEDSHNPRKLDLVYPDGHRVRCIYSTEGDTLKIAQFFWDSVKQPETFGGDAVICTYERLK
jgi:uncharacterized protein (TIGR03067 family)